MYLHEEEERYRVLVDKLSERLALEDPDSHFRRLVRYEADRRIRLYLGPALVIVAMSWAWSNLGWTGLGIVVVLAAAVPAWELVRIDRDPGTGRHRSVAHAEDLLRLTVIAEMHHAGERVWAVADRQRQSDPRTLVPCGGARWDGSWKRIHDWALELERASPAARTKRLLEAAGRARPALEQGEAMAATTGAELPSWALDTLHLLRTSGETRRGSWPKALFRGEMKWLRSNKQDRSPKSA